MDKTNLPPLPSPAVWDPGRYGVCYSEEQMREYAAAALRATTGEGEWPTGWSLRQISGGAIVVIGPDGRIHKCIGAPAVRAAAPTPAEPLRNAEAVAWVDLNRGQFGASWHTSDPAGIMPEGRYYYYAPQQPAITDAMVERALEGWYQHQERCRFTTVEGSLRKALEAALAAAPPPPLRDAPTNPGEISSKVVGPLRDAGAVAWIAPEELQRFDGDPKSAACWGTVTLSSGEGDGRTVPLYTHPAPAQVDEATVERVAQAIANVIGHGMGEKCEPHARAALNAAQEVDRG